jgi:hypothetical protein
MAANPEPSKFELARAIVERQRFGVLSTLSVKKSGHPYGSFAAYATDHSGRPVFLFTDLSAHTRDLLADQRASLVVIDNLNPEAVADSARLTLIGLVALVPEDEVPEARALYLESFPEAAEWVDLNFRFFRMDISDIHFVGGFGMAGWVSARDYYTLRR